MQLIPRWAKLNFCVLPIGDNFTMDCEDAIIAAEFVKCDVVVGVHYNTFGFIKIDTEKAHEDFKAAGKTLLLPAIGETIDYIKIFYKKTLTIPEQLLHGKNYWCSKSKRWCRKNNNGH